MNTKLNSRYQNSNKSKVLMSRNILKRPYKKMKLKINEPLYKSINTMEGRLTRIIPRHTPKESRTLEMARLKDELCRDLCDVLQHTVKHYSPRMCGDSLRCSQEDFDKAVHLVCNEIYNQIPIHEDLFGYDSDQYASSSEEE